jgi:arginine deiminase
VRREETLLMAAIYKYHPSFAHADFEVKGGGRDPVYAVERAVLTITRARTGR